MSGGPVCFRGASCPLPRHRCVSPELSCNFERGTCGWYQDQASDFSWVRGTGQGQGSDHTTGSGKGLAALPGTPGSPGDPTASCPQGWGVPCAPQAAPCPWGKLSWGSPRAPQSGNGVQTQLGAPMSVSPPLWLSPTPGYFLAADPSAPWSRGQRAQLITYYQDPAAAPRCLSFWYRLAGPQIGTQPRGVLPGRPAPLRSPTGSPSVPAGCPTLPSAQAP